jgi:hypoxanthine phosphoribosyltransferase
MPIQEKPGILPEFTLTGWCSIHDRRYGDLLPETSRQRGPGRLPGLSPGGAQAHIGVSGAVVRSMAPGDTSNILEGQKGLMIPEEFPCELITWQDSYEMARALAIRVKEDCFGPDIVIAIGRGGYVPARVVCDFLLQDMLTSFKMEHWGSAAKEKPEVKIRFPLAVEITDQKVLVVDDVTDTGETLKHAIEYLRSLSPRVVRTAVLQHKSGSRFLPDYFAREEKEWRWIIYPWAVHEDVVGFCHRILDHEVLTPDQLKETLFRHYRIHVPLVAVNDALEDLLAGAEIGKSGERYGKSLIDTA